MPEVLFATRFRWGPPVLLLLPLPLPRVVRERLEDGEGDAFALWKCQAANQQRRLPSNMSLSRTHLMAVAFAVISGVLAEARLVVGGEE
jgi:hypothetical protein